MDNLEYEEINKEMEKITCDGVVLASKNGINFTKFKAEVEPFLNRKNSEDQWVWDYEAYLCDIIVRFISIEEFAITYYGNDFEK